MDEIEIKSNTCWLCGEETAQKERHHAIPQFLKPKKNLCITVCRKCHQKINSYTIQSVPKFKAIDNLLNSLKEAIKKYEKKLDRYRI